MALHGDEYEAGPALAGGRPYQPTICV
jgi:hypothetical protein